MAPLSSSPTTVLISEVGPRDGLQSVKATMPTADKLRWISALHAAGVREVAVFTAASDAFNRKNINATVDESIERFLPILERARNDGVKVRGYVSTVLGCPYQGEVEVRDVVRIAKRIFSRKPINSAARPGSVQARNEAPSSTPCRTCSM